MTQHWSWQSLDIENYHIPYIKATRPPESKRDKIHNLKMMTGQKTCKLLILLSEEQWEKLKNTSY